MEKNENEKMMLSKLELERTSKRIELVKAETELTSKKIKLVMVETEKIESEYKFKMLSDGLDFLLNNVFTSKEKCDNIIGTFNEMPQWIRTEVMNKFSNIVDSLNKK